MNYTNISTFLAIAACKSLSKAAELLYVTQPTLSHRLSSLETELGTPLISRRKGVRTIELTEAGKRFLPIAENWKELLRQTQDICKSVPPVSLRVSNVDSLNEYFMPYVYTHFLEKHTSCNLNILTLRSEAAYHAIENHELDMAFITNPRFLKKVRTIPVFHESMKFICKSTSSYKKTVSPGDLNPAHEIYIPWSNPFVLWHDYWFGSESDLRVTIDNMGLIEHFLQMENAWAVVPSTVCYSLSQKNDFRTCEINHGPGKRTCYVISNNQQDLSSLQDEFIETLLGIACSYPDVEVVWKDK